MAVETFPGKSEMASRMRAFDWSKTDLGAPDRWPAHLRVAVSLCLTSRLPVVVYWGPHHTVLYNDAYVSFLGPAKHPRSLGRPGQECWREIWDTIGPMLEGVRYTGSATLSHDVQMFFARAVPLEEVIVRFTFGPILGPDGKTVDGIFCPCTETTEQVVGARRLETLRRLGVRPVGARSIGEAATAAAAALDDNRHDVPYAAVYGIDHDETRASRLATAGPPESIDQLPLRVDLDDAEARPWPLATVARTMVAAEARASGAGLVLPIPGAARHRLGGLLAVGVSPHRPLDDGYRAFLQRAADHVGAAIEEARAFEEADRRKKEFLAILSQELRGPLAPLGTMVEVLKRSPKDGEVVRQAHGTIERQFSQLVRIVDDLVHPGRPADGAAAPARAAAKPPPTPRRILVVDDDHDSLTSLSMLLELAGNETYTARNGLEAVRVAESLRPEVVLMDLGMPTLSGVEAARRMRAQSWGKGMVIVALTGRGQDEDRRTSRDAGFDAHMVKPVNHEALLDVLATLEESA